MPASPPPPANSTLPSNQIPAEPEYPDKVNPRTADGTAKLQAWRKAHEQWKSSLTASQVLLLKQQTRQQNEANPYNKHHNLPKPEDDYSWEKTAATRHLNPSIISDLKANKVAFGDSVRQSFQPYLSGPVFITSDSVLNTFHVLLEDSVRQLEFRNAVQFHTKFELLLKTALKLPSVEDVMEPARAAKAMQHLQRVLGPAMVLTGTPLDFFDKDLQPQINEQVALIREASVTALPPFLAPADPGSLIALDYSRFKPLGFYTDNTSLSSYFAAVRWLQLVPFRASREVEYDAMVLLALASKDSHTKRWLHALTAFYGRPDDPGPCELQEVIEHQWPRNAALYDARLRAVQNEVTERLIEDNYYAVNSDLRASRTLQHTFDQLVFRVIPATRLPDAELFQELLEAQMKPEGLDFAALLGSEFALAQLPAKHQPLLASKLPWEPPPPSYREPDALGVSERYLLTLSTLFLPPDKAAPDFMRTPVWEAKNCQTALAGWAQLRHTYTLQSKRNEYYLGLVRVPPGFIEPNPEFFSRYAQLVRTSYKELRELACFVESVDTVIEHWRSIAASLKQGSKDLRAQKIQSIFAPKLFNEAIELAYGSEPPLEYLNANKRSPDQFDVLAQLIEQKATLCQKTQAIPPQAQDPLEIKWHELELVAHTLDSLCQKQLRGQDWNKENERFLTTYGETMASIMGYEGNSWLTPHDDAPRWAEVCAYPAENKSLAIGIGRPRSIYVLYPWNGMEVLCVGSVMQYHEYYETKKLTDKEWLDLLDSPQAPEIPEWLSPYEGKPEKPVERH